MLRAVLFDLGDTLLNFGPVDHLAAFRKGAELAHRYLLERGEPVPEFEAYHRGQLRAIKRAYFWSRFGRRDCDSLEVMARINRKMGLTVRREELCRLAALYYEPVRQQGVPEPEVHETLRSLRDRGCKLGLISNTIVPGVTLDDHLEREGLLELLPERLYSCDVGCRKPQRRIFRMALARLGVGAGEAMFVGDTLRADVMGASRVGMTTVLKAPGGQRPSGRIQPDYTVAALRELPGVLDRHEQRA